MSARPFGQPLGLLAAALLLPALLAGCAAPAVEGANMAKDEVVRQRHMDRAQAGDPEAQVRVGESYCCAPDGVSALYDNQRATEWLCRAAAQGYGPADFKLGKIYSGDLIDGVRVVRRAGLAVTRPPTNRAIALHYLQRAEAAGVEGAARRFRSVWDDASPVEREAFRGLEAGGQSVPCTWNEVIR